MRALMAVTVCLLVAAFFLWTTISELQGGEPCYDFNCSDNRPCENDAGCLGSCYCDLGTYECVPN